MSSILDNYGLCRLITEPRGVTPVSKTLIGLCITHFPQKVTNSLASFALILIIIPLDLLIVTVMAPASLKGGNLLNTFNERNKFLTDHNRVPWANVDLYSDPNDMWKEMFLTNGILLLCKSQHFTERQLVMIKELYPLVSTILIAFRTYNMTASIDFGSFICSLYILLAQ